MSPRVSHRKMWRQPRPWRGSGAERGRHCCPRWVQTTHARLERVRCMMCGILQQRRVREVVAAARQGARSWLLLLLQLTWIGMDRLWLRKLANLQLNVCADVALCVRLHAWIALTSGATAWLRTGGAFNGLAPPPAMMACHRYSSCSMCHSWLFCRFRRCRLATLAALVREAPPISHMCL